MTNRSVTLIQVKLICFNLPSVATFSTSSRSKCINLHTNFTFSKYGHNFFHRQKFQQIVHLIRGKLVTFINMYTKTRNIRKKRPKGTNITKSTESHGNKNACQLYLATFVLQSFCFVSILSLVSALLFWLFGQCCFYSENQVSFSYSEFLRGVF